MTNCAFFSQSYYQYYGTGGEPRVTLTLFTLLVILFGFYFTNYLGIGYRTLMLFSLGRGVVFIGLINTGPGTGNPFVMKVAGSS